MRLTGSPGLPICIPGSLTCLRGNAVAQVRGQRRVDDLDELELGLLPFLEQGRAAAEEHRDEVDADHVYKTRGEVLAECQGASPHGDNLVPGHSLGLPQRILDTAADERVDAAVR